jgi:hypothetical protein
VRAAALRPRAPRVPRSFRAPLAALTSTNGDPGPFDRRSPLRPKETRVPLGSPVATFCGRHTIQASALARRRATTIHKVGRGIKLRVLSREGLTIEQPQLSDTEETKWRAEFKKLGREAVTYQAQFRSYHPDRKQELALLWLREREDEAERRERDAHWYAKWTWDAALAAAVLAFVSIVLMLIWRL